MKLSAREVFSLFLKQSQTHGFMGGLKRALDPKVQRLESRRLLASYIRPHDQGVEFLTSAQSIGPSHDHINTKLVNVTPAQISLTSESFTAEKIPYEDMTFDFIIAEDVLPLVGDRAAAIKEWYRAMNEGGHLFLFVKKDATNPSPAELEKAFSTDRWEVMQVLDPVTDLDNSYALVARRKREKSGIIEILKMQQAGADSGSSEGSSSS